MMLILLLSHLSLPPDRPSSYIKAHCSISECILTLTRSKVCVKLRECDEHTQSFLPHRKDDFEALVGEMKCNSDKAISALALLPSSVGYITKLDKLNKFWHQVQRYLSRFQSQQ